MSPGLSSGEYPRFGAQYLTEINGPERRTPAVIVGAITAMSPTPTPDSRKR
jgi:hypothetical protein